MIDHIVVDVEIQKTIEETPGGWDATHLLGVSCACVWEYEGQRMRIYGPDDVTLLQKRLLQAERISGYNIWAFDFPVIWGYSKQEWQHPDALGPRHFAAEELDQLKALQSLLFPKTNDLLRRIWQEGLGLNPDKFDKSTHANWGLDVVGHGTLRMGKIGYGGDAPKWFQEGQWARVANYCADDVGLERDLTDFIDHFGYVVNGKTQQIVFLPENKRAK